MDFLYALHCFNPSEAFGIRQLHYGVLKQETPLLNFRFSKLEIWGFDNQEKLSFMVHMTGFVRVIRI